MRRFFITLITFALVVCALAVPAFAEGINYRDYETNVKVDGDRDLVTVEFPTEWIHGLASFVGTGGTGAKHWDGQNLDWYVPDRGFSELQFYIAPFGTTLGAYDSEYSGDYLSLDNIPEDSVFSISYSVIASDLGGKVIWDSVQQRAYSVNGDTCSLYYKETETLNEIGNGWHTFYMDINPESADGWFPEYLFKISAYDGLFDGEHIHISVDRLAVEMSISSLYRLQEQSKITIELLEEVDRQLAEQGKTMEEVLAEQELTNDKLDGIHDSIGDTNDKLDGVHGAIDDTNDKLDDITDYKPEVETPEGGEVVGDLENVEDNLMEDVNDGFEEAEQLQLSVLEALLQYVTAFGAVSYIFDLFAWIPFIKILLSVSLALGIVATLLNIGLSVSSGASRSKSEGKQGAKDKYFVGPPRPPRK